MKFFGKIIFFLFTFTLYSSPKAYLIKTEILKGEPNSLHIELNTDGEIELTKNVFSENGVTLEYIGLEESITTINFKVTRKKIIKFRVLTSKTGDLTTPEINLTFESKNIKIDPIKFKVKNEKYKPKNQFNTGNSIFDKLFSGNGFPELQERVNENPEPDDFQIHFYPTRTNIYVGETILSTFALYYRNVQNPNFQRIDQKSLDFPFFTYELLQNVSIQLKQTDFVDGKEFFVSPYDREVYMITALRKGKYQLGESEFAIEGGPLSYFPVIKKKARKKTILVKELPEPKPENFSNQVGDYSAKLIFQNNTGRVGDSIPFNLVIKGSGGLGNWDDPLKNYCNTNNCQGKIVSLNESKSKKVAKLSSGEYGFETETIFNYTFYPNIKADIELPSFQINFFDPNKVKYSSVEIKFPVLKIDAALPFQIEKVPSKIFLFWKNWLFYLVGLGFFLFAFYLAKDELFLRAKKIFERFQFIEMSIPAEIINFDKEIGNKKGALLRVFLVNKGFNRAKIEEIIKMNLKQSSISELYQNSNPEQRKYLKNLIKDLKKENL